LVYSILLGGESEEATSGIAIDSTGAAFVAGATRSRTFPVSSGTYPTFWDGVTKAYITKVSADGSQLVYSTLIGDDGNHNDTGVYYVWFIDAGNPANPLQVRKRGGAPLNWTLLGAADLNYDFVADMIYIGPQNQIKALMGKSRELGMRTFDWSLFELYNEGHIAYDEAIRNADSANELRLNIKLNGTRAAPAASQAAEMSIQAPRAAVNGAEAAPSEISL